MQKRGRYVIGREVPLGEGKGREEIGGDFS